MKKKEDSNELSIFIGDATMRNVFYLVETKD